MTWWREYTKRQRRKPEEDTPEIEFEDPWSAFERMHDQMDNMFSGFFSKFPEAAKFREPLADIKETDKEIKVFVELPGVKKENIMVITERDVLAIEARTKKEKKEEREGFFRQERGYQAFRRAFSLPSEVTPQKTKWRFENGILEVTLQKKEASS